MGMKLEKSKGGRRRDGVGAASITTTNIASSSSSSFRASPCTVTPISEDHQGELNGEVGCMDGGGGKGFNPPPTTPGSAYKHQPTPLRATATSRPTAGDDDHDGRSVSCNKCRPSSRDKISVVHLDANGRKRTSAAAFSPLPNGLFKSFFSSLTGRKSPSAASANDAAADSAGKEEQWKLAVAELSHKLLNAGRSRDEALVEAARLKVAVAGLEKKLDRLELYCRELRSGTDACADSHPHSGLAQTVAGQTRVVEPFLRTVAEARGGVRHLSRALAVQLRQAGKVAERVAVLLQSPESKGGGAPIRQSRSLVFYLEALLNRTFYEDFETSGFQRGVSDPILSPLQRCEANLASHTLLKGLTWEEVLNKGTKHFSEDFSRFCDRKMSEIVGMLGWTRAWPEPVLQAFFGAAKVMWLVHLLAFAVHPSLPIFRVEKGANFDSGHMEDMAVGRKAGRLVPATVLAMVAPGFYVHNSVVKCKVLCRYSQQDKSSMPENTMI